MASPNLFLVVMAGGSGTRFWPKSTSKMPKQLLGFTGGDASAQTLLTTTIGRFDAIVPKTQRMIVTTRLLEQTVAEQAPEVKVLAEPQGRNTAPCIYWAARAVEAVDPDGVMLVMPSDHFMTHPDRFIATVRAAAEWAHQNNDLVALGVKPDRPETGYGYLRIGSAHQAGPSASTCSKVEAFVEKPNLEKARQFLEAGNYLWNGGMFLWKARTILAAFDQFMPEMKREWNAAEGKVELAYPKMTATSIDYGIMEKARNVVAFPLDCGWDDLGSWTSLEGLASSLGAQHAGGVVTGGQAIAIDSTGNIVDAPGKLIALLGVKDLIVVEHGGAILIADKNRAQDLRLVVEQVKKLRPELA